MVSGDGVVIGSNFCLYEFGGLYFFSFRMSITSQRSGLVTPGCKPMIMSLNEACSDVLKGWSSSTIHWQYRCLCCVFMSIFGLMCLVISCISNCPFFAEPLPLCSFQRCQSAQFGRGYEVELGLVLSNSGAKRSSFLNLCIASKPLYSYRSLGLNDEQQQSISILMMFFFFFPSDLIVESGSNGSREDESG